MDYTKLASSASIDQTIKALAARGVEATLINDKSAALSKIRELIPQGVSVMNGSSVTLEQIGFIELLKSGSHGWNNLHEAIVKESDPAKQGILRKAALTSDYYLGSVHALAETGEFVVASNTGSQLPHIVFTSPNLILVVGTQKIVPTLGEALKRLEEYVVPLEDKHMHEKHGVGTQLNKIVIFKGENLRLGRKIRLILVNEVLGF